VIIQNIFTFSKNIGDSRFHGTFTDLRWSGLTTSLAYREGFAHGAV